MSDELDNELLGLVGDSDSDDGDSGDDFNQLDQTQAVDEDFPSAEPLQSVENVEDGPTRTKGVAQKVKARRRKVRQESEEVDDAA